MKCMLQTFAGRYCTLLLGATMLASQVNAQKSRMSVMDEKWQNGNSFAGFKPEQEVLEKRNRNAKHFRNADGTFTLQTGNVYHYKDAAGAWQDIDLAIRPAQRNDGTGYANETNEIKDYFPAAPGAGKSIKMIGESGITFRWWNEPVLKLRQSGNNATVIQPNTASTATAEKNMLTYHQLYQGISEQFVIKKNGIENNTIIHSLTPDIANMPASGMLELSHFIPLEAGWKVDVEGTVTTTDFTAKTFHIEVPGMEMGVYFSPIVAFDHTLTQQEALYVQFAPADKLTAAEKQQKQNNVYQASYAVSFVPGGIRVTTQMPASWLKAQGRAFPVTIDPTVTFTPTPLYSGGYYKAPMSHWYGFQRHADLYLSSELGIANVFITNLEYQRMSTSGTNNSKPAKVFMRTTSATTLSGTAAWNSTTYTGGLTALYDASADFHGSTAGWKMITLTTPFAYTTNNLLIMVYDEYGSSGSAKYMNMCESYSSARQAYKRQDVTDPGDGSATDVESMLPETRLTYTPLIPACVTTVVPANAATGVCSGSTILRWNKSLGATGYDVYLNSGTTATTVVSANQADTSYIAATGIGPYAWKIVPKGAAGDATGCNTFTFTTIAGTTPTVSITVGPNDTLCPFLPTTFTATSTSGGTTPVYTWKKNGATVGTNSPTYTTSSLINNDTVQVVMTSNSTACLTTNTVSSNKIRMTILSAPNATITASGPLQFCSGGSVTLTAPAGAASYQWVNNNGNILGATGSSYVASYTDRYTVVVRGANCNGVGDSVSVLARQLPYPIISVAGTTLSVPNIYLSYQWYQGNTAISGATTNTYTFSQRGNYQVEVMDSSGCYGKSFAMPVSVAGVTGQDQVSVYPNPAQDIVHINSAAAVNIAIRSMDGKLVMTKHHTKDIDISQLASSVYMLYISDDKGKLLKIEKLTKRQ